MNDRKKLPIGLIFDFNGVISNPKYQILLTDAINNNFHIIIWSSKKFKNLIKDLKIILLKLVGDKWKETVYILDQSYCTNTGIPDIEGNKFKPWFLKPIQKVRDYLKEKSIIINQLVFIDDSIQKLCRNPEHTSIIINKDTSVDDLLLVIKDISIKKNSEECLQLLQKKNSHLVPSVGELLKYDTQLKKSILKNKTNIKNTD